MGLPPAHRVDHQPVYVLSFDGAWDNERLNYEYDVITGELDPDLEVPWSKVEDHPWRKWRRGETRADIAQIQHYLDEAAAPVRFVFRRLSLREWTEVENIQNRSIPEGRNYALRHSLEKVDGVELTLDRNGRESGPLSVKDMDSLRSLAGDEGFRELGFMAIQISRELLDTEKKP